MAFRREFLERHGLYDACIVGSGDLALMAAAYGCLEVPPTFLSMSPPHREHYLRWARPFFESVRGAVGFAKVDLYHLWDGRLIDRGYRQRHEAMRRFDFDPQADLLEDASGLWRWKSDKCELHDYVKNYFSSRREDPLPSPPSGTAAIRTDDLSSFGDAEFIAR